MKEQTMTSIDGKVKKKAKEFGINISDFLESKLREKVEGKIQIEVNEPTKCDFCGKKGEKATRDNLTGLTWLWPDEKWICDKCLKNKSRKNLIGIASKRG